MLNNYADFPEFIRLSDPSVSESKQYYMWRLIGFRLDNTPFEVMSTSLHRLAEWYLKFSDRMDSTREITLQEATWKKPLKRDLNSFSKMIGE
jgi:hypothetical protein